VSTTNDPEREAGVSHSRLPKAVSHSRLPKASDLLAERLRARILGEGMRPGDPLPAEGELITSYEFSRGTVREALRLLESDGLIEIKRGPKGGIRVRYPDLTQLGRSLALLLSVAETSLRSFLEFRMLIEPTAAAAAARTATAEQKQWLSRIADDEARSGGVSHSVEFHDAIGICSNNEIFRVVISALREELSWHVSEERLSAADMAATSRAHGSVARAIQLGDATRAELGMRRHLEQFGKVLESHGRLDEAIIPRNRWLSKA